MLKRGYIILIAGGALVVAGIVISAAWAGPFVGQFMQENSFIDQAVVGPSETINATLQVNDISRPIAVGLHIEPESANVILRETVRDPGGRVVNTNEFSKEFFNTLYNSTGKFKLTVSNQGTSPVNVDVLFGYIPFGFVRENNQVDLSPLNGIIIGIVLFVVGVISLIVGIVFVIIDRRREKQRQSPLT
jgi:flagellar basal body-associated protein FliL